MKATEANFLDFLKKSPQFVIPIYQRTVTHGPSVNAASFGMTSSAPAVTMPSRPILSVPSYTSRRAYTMYQVSHLYS